MSMMILASMLFVILAWYLGTGLLAMLNRVPGDVPVRALVLGTVFVGVAIAGIEASLGVATVAGAYVGFVGAFTLWAWLEHSYLAGVITGPQRGSCPPDASGAQRFVLGVGLSLYHELSVIAVGAVLIWLSLDAANPMAAWTFGTLWIMRWSAKLNLFLGVANMDLGLLPERLRYLATYMNRRSMNALFPFSILGGMLLLMFHVNTLQGSEPGSYATVAAVLLATLTALAVMEHCVMMLPFRDSRLWRWAAQRDLLRRQV